MYTNFKYKEELYKLIDNEDSFDFFRSLIKEQNKYNPEYAKHIMDILVEFAEENHLEMVKAWTYYYLGWHHLNLSEHDISLNYFLETSEIFEKRNCKEGLIYVCNGFNSLYCLTGQFSLSNEWGLRGISLAEEIDDKDALIVLLINTGINYIQMKDFNMAKEVLMNVVMREYKLTRHQKISLNICLAEVEINIGNPRLALEYIFKAEALEYKTEVSIDISEIYKLKGMAYAKLHEYDMAEKEFIKCYDVADSQGYNYEKCCSIIEWSKVSVSVGRSSRAIRALEESIEISKVSNFNVLLKESNYLLHEIYKEIGNYEKSLYYLEAYIKIDETIYDYEQNQLMAQLKLKHARMEADLYKLLYDKTEQLSNLGQKIISNLNFNSIIDIIRNEINQLIHMDTFGIAVYNSEKEMLEYHFTDGKTGLKKSMNLELDDNSVTSYCIKNRKDIIIRDIHKEYDKYINEMKYNITFENERLEKSMMYTPLIVNDRVVGVMTVQSYQVNTYNKNDLNTLKIIANYIAIAIENAISYKKVESLAMYDDMTGFLTRFEIIRLGEMIHKKYKDDKKCFSVIMIDIDDFKVINDTYGHVYGDKAINMITRTISSCIRTNDYVGRYGGDEFLLICPGLSQNEAYDVAERIRGTVNRQNYMLDENIVVNITISLGIYAFGSNEISFIDGIKEADKYLYHAKKSSKNKAAFNAVPIEK